MTMKFGTFLLLSGIAFSAAAQDEVTGTIYSQSDLKGLPDGGAVVYEFGSWYSIDAETSTLWPAVLAALSTEDVSVMVEGIVADANGVGVKYLSAEKLLAVTCDAAAQGKTQVLITDFNGVTHGLVNVNEPYANISLSNYVPGTYVVAVAVDGKLVKTIKLILK
ncbi:MAG: hypothetical protein K2H47_00985 [Muribaculaceae bacterium]|nr:hypothetical protein [Muribaculaceae bacterium]